MSACLLCFKVYQIEDATPEDANDTTIQCKLDTSRPKYHAVELKKVKQIPAKSEKAATDTVSASADGATFAKDHCSVSGHNSNTVVTVTTITTTTTTTSNDVDREDLNDGKIYTCIGVVCSPAFVVGSTRQLRRVHVKKTETQQRDTEQRDMDQRDVEHRDVGHRDVEHRETYNNGGVVTMHNNVRRYPMLNAGMSRSSAAEAVAAATLLSQRKRKYSNNQQPYGGGMVPINRGNGGNGGNKTAMMNGRPSSKSRRTTTASSSSSSSSLAVVPQHQLSGQQQVPKQFVQYLYQQNLHPHQDLNSDGVPVDVTGTLLRMYHQHQRQQQLYKRQFQQQQEMLWQQFQQQQQQLHRQTNQLMQQQLRAKQQQVYRQRYQRQQQPPRPPLPPQQQPPQQQQPPTQRLQLPQHLQLNL